MSRFSHSVVFITKSYLFDMAALSMTKSLSSKFCSCVLSNSNTLRSHVVSVKFDLLQFFWKCMSFFPLTGRWYQFSDPVYRLTNHTKTYIYNVLPDKLFVGNVHNAIIIALIWNCFTEIIPLSLNSFSFVASPSITIYSRWCCPVVTGLSEGFWSLLSPCVLWEYFGQWTVPTKLQRSLPTTDARQGQDSKLSLTIPGL